MALFSVHKICPSRLFTYQGLRLVHANSQQTPVPKWTRDLQFPCLSDRWVTYTFHFILPIMADTFSRRLCQKVGHKVGQRSVVWNNLGLRKIFFRFLQKVFSQSDRDKLKSYVAAHRTWRACLRPPSALIFRQVVLHTSSHNYNPMVNKRKPTPLIIIFRGHVLQTASQNALISQASFHYFVKSFLTSTEGSSQLTFFYNLTLFECKYEIAQVEIIRRKCTHCHYRQYIVIVIFSALILSSVRPYL